MYKIDKQKFVDSYTAMTNKLFFETFENQIVWLAESISIKSTLCNLFLKMALNQIKNHFIYVD